MKNTRIVLAPEWTLPLPYSSEWPSLINEPLKASILYNQVSGKFEMIYVINDYAPNSRGTAYRYVSILATTHEENDCSRGALNMDSTDTMVDFELQSGAFESEVEKDFRNYQIMPVGSPGRLMLNVADYINNIELVKMRAVEYVPCLTNLKEIGTISFNANQRSYEHVYYEEASESVKFVTGSVEYDGDMCDPGGLQIELKIYEHDGDRDL